MTKAIERKRILGYIAVLERRIRFLNDRVTRSGQRGVDYDKHEAGALRFAVELMEGELWRINNENNKGDNQLHA